MNKTQLCEKNSKRKPQGKQVGLQSQGKLQMNTKWRLWEVFVATTVLITFIFFCLFWDTFLMTSKTFCSNYIKSIFFFLPNSDCLWNIYESYLYVLTNLKRLNSALIVSALVYVYEVTTAKRFWEYLTHWSKISVFFSKCTFNMTNEPHLQASCNKLNSKYYLCMGSQTPQVI